MADLTVSEIRLVEKGHMLTAPTAETLNEGEAARYDGSGDFTGANATLAAEAEFEGIVLDVRNGVATVAGDGCTVYLGSALDSLDFGATVFLSDTDKTLADTAGTVSTAVGRVERLYEYGGTSKKVLRVVRGA